MYDEFTGDNHEVLAKKYGVTLQRIYAIIKEQRQFEFNTRQFYLWDD
ncbi:Mor transcription activator family protein [Moraxella nonliquefaciens]